MEELTDALEGRATAMIAEIDRLGGAVKAIEAGWIQREIMKAAYAYQRSLEADDTVVVGVNRYQVAEEEEIPRLTIDARLQEQRVEQVRKLRRDRDAGAADDALAAVVAAARGSQNLFPRVLTAVRARATLGEICIALDGVFGRYREVAVL